MDTVKQAISRIGRSVRHIDAGSVPRAKPPTIQMPQKSSKTIIYKPNKHLPREQLEKYKPLARNFQRQTFRDFLQPLGAIDLKTFEDTRPKYDVETAKKNWQAKSNLDRLASFEMFVNDRDLFNKVTSLLIELTPSELHPSEPSEALYEQVKQHELYEKSLKFEHTPKYHFHEIPPIPNPLTPEVFQEYIYFLTHSKILYRNSSSLSSGLVPELLLFTHKLDNTKFKPYRSIDTYNYLIKYFGCDKNQSKFARELILVMNEDGHLPNIDTINILLRACRTHSHIRSVQNTYSIVLKTLLLAKTLNLEANLTTWNRVYDCINNIFLKELFINKISHINLPVSRNLSMRILDDFVQTTRATQEVVEFIEKDLKMTNWKKDPAFSNKAIRHRISQAKNNNQAQDLLHQLLKGDIKLDGSSVKEILSAIQENPYLTNKLPILLMAYVKFAPTIDNYTNNCRILSCIIWEMCVNRGQYRPDCIAFLIRCMVHETSEVLDLPREMVQVERTEEDEEIMQALSPHSDGPRPMPENYRIVKRMVGFVMENFEGKLRYFNGYMHQDACDMWDPLSDEEVISWNRIKSVILAMDFSESESRVGGILGLVKSPIQISPEVGEEFRHVQYRRIGNAVARERLHKMEEGRENSVIRELRERGVYNE